MSSYIEERRALETKVIDKAMAEPGFREELKANPAQALKNAFGLELPAGSQPRIIEDSPMEPTLVLPFDPAANDGELEDAELESVAGGLKFTTILRASEGGSRK